MKKNIFNSFKIRTIFIFSIINILLIVLLARFSYLFVRTLYLNQFHDQMHVALNIASQNLDKSMLEYLLPEKQTLSQKYFFKILKRLNTTMELNNLFLFNDQWRVLSALNRSDAITGLLVYKLFLKHLQTGETFISEPFKGNDGHWYLWAFRRLDVHYFLGLRENAQRLALIDRLSTKFVYFGFIGILITLLAALFIAQSIHRPLQQITLFSNKIGKGDFQAKAPNSSLKEIKLLTNALAAMRNELAQRDQEKEQLLAQIAHELRNPLGGIELLAGLVKDDLPQDHHNVEYLNKILSEVNFLKAQINEFLHYSRPRPPRKVEIDLQKFATEIQKRWQAELKAKAINFEIELQMPVIVFDTQHLQQIVNNLMANSIQAMDGKPGSIVLRSANNCLQIEDSGPGFSPDIQSQIFDPFFTTRANGIGLGLTICRKLCTLNGATIEVLNRKTGGGLVRICPEKNSIQETQNGK